jgi:GT2 family glycosyltransferase
MIGLAELNPDIGAVNPSSNNFGQIPSPGMELNEYAKSLGPLAGRYLEIGTAISFCMLVRGEAVRKIGCLDEAFETMFYEDTDYSMRINQEGYKCVLQKDVYVWHHGHKTSSKLKRGRELFDRNRDIFCKKWGKPLRVILCGNATAGAEAFRNALATSIELARDGNYVYLVAAPDNISGSREEIFGRYDFIEHANVHFISGPARGFGWFCLWRLLLKRKKRYDLAIAQDSRVASLMGKFGFLHGAKVLAAFDFDAALEAVHDLKFR